MNLLFTKCRTSPSISLNISYHYHMGIRIYTQKHFINLNHFNFYLIFYIGNIFSHSYLMYIHHLILGARYRRHYSEVQVSNLSKLTGIRNGKIIESWKLNLKQFQSGIFFFFCIHTLFFPIHSQGNFMKMVL